jgi:hypothetical protein
MSTCASFPPVEERTRAAVRLFNPEEVATVIDLFAPLDHARVRAVSSVRAIEWGRVLAAVTLTIGLCVAATAVVSAGPQPHASPRREPAATPRPTITPIAEPAPIPAPVPAPPPARPEPAPIATAPIIAVVIEPRAPSPTALLASLNRTAMAAYQRGQLPAAREVLSRALRLCQRPALVWHDLCARTHLNTGVVLAGGHQQGGLAAKHFRIARAIRPDIGVPAHLAGRGIAAAFADANRW